MDLTTYQMLHDHSTSMLKVPSAPGYFADRLGHIWKNGRPISESDNGSGYMKVATFVEGKRVGRLVHIMVAEAFHGPRPNGLQTRHINGNSKDNRPENLAYGTAQDNCDDRLVHGTRPMGQRTYNSVFTDEQVLNVRKRVMAGAKQRDIAAELGVSFATLNKAVVGETYKHLPYAVRTLALKRGRKGA